MLLIALPPAQRSQQHAWKAPNPSLPRSHLPMTSKHLCAKGRDTRNLHREQDMSPLPSAKCMAAPSRMDPGMLRRTSTHQPGTFTLGCNGVNRSICW